MKLSVVATLYRSARHIGEFHARASAAAKKIAGGDYEIVFVNDGSPDDSLTIAKALSESDEHVRVVDLSRNFGHHKAMMAGLRLARGDLIFLLDSDLEEQPEWMIEFHQHMQTDGSDVVYGVQERRKGGPLERWSGRLFYRLFSKLSGVAIPENVVTARLMTRRYVDALLQHDEREIVIAGLWVLTGFQQSPKTVQKISSSETTYTLRRKLAVLVNAVTSLSSAPLVAIFYFGVVISMLSGAYAAYLIINKLFFAAPMSGWTSVMASIWLIGGLIISFVGVVGIYLSKVFMEVKRRPNSIVRQIYGKQ